MPLIHQIEDLQFICFALVFGVMAFQSRRDAIIRYVWCSYLIAVAVACVDYAVTQPLSLVSNALILSILSVRYAVLAKGFSSFTGKGRGLSIVCFGLSALAFCMLTLTLVGIPRSTLLALYFAVLATQLVFICAILMRSRDTSTRIPRWLLSFLFFLTTLYRLNQMRFALSQKTSHDIWLRDQGLFLNSTILGCLLPFTIVWMLNARDNAILLKQSIIDPLTTLLNRRGLADAANRELSRYVREQKDFAVAVCDIDHFKSLNDTHGHTFGDQVLTSAASLLRSQLRQIDIIARTGGEEFLILLPLTSANEMLPVLERIRQSLEEQTLRTEEGTQVNITISIGVTNTSGRQNLNWTDLEKEADAALYTAKEQGRNRIVQTEPAPLP